jgi:hypothetical protein
MILSTDLLLNSKVRERIYKDKRLAAAINFLELERLESFGYRLKIGSTVGGASEINEKLVWIVRVALAFAPVAEVWFDGDLFSVAALAIVSPSINRPADGRLDKELRMNQHQQRSIMLETAMAALANDYSVFLISPDGVYQDVRFHAGTRSLIAAEDLLGKRLHEVIGEASAETILECFKRALTTRSHQECHYDVTFKTGERRWYMGRVHPSQDQQPFMLIVRRIN